ncbi:MAG: AAA family ATPase, partial [Gaiellales bacterium]
PSTTGSEGWLRMWEAARSFVEGECNHPFPPTERGAVCPLCRQELHEDAHLRLQRLDEFVRNTLERELETARGAHADALDAVEASGVDRALGSQGVTLLQDEDPELAEAVQRWLETGAARVVALREGRDAPELLAPPAATVGELAAARKEEAAHQRSLVDPQKLETLRRRVIEGDARALLSDRLSEFREWYTTLGTIAALERVRQELDTTALSHKQTELAKGLVTDALRSAVREELDALGFPHLQVDLSCRTDRGTTVARMQLGNGSAPVVDVLSAGEQRASALAFFLAEARTSASAGGLVFDDPSSAFDVERLEHIARRIVELAERRQQVIVFSCDVVFCWCLQAAADARRVALAVRPIARMGESVGIVRPHQPWPGETLKVRLGRLRAALQELEAQERKSEIDQYERGAKSLAGDIREAWERAIEEELFRGVVMRFQRDVRALKIRDVVVTEEATAEVLDAMNEVSAYHHEAALAKPVPTPSSQQLRGFLERLETFRDGLKKRKKEKEKQTAPSQVA